VVLKARTRIPLKRSACVKRVRAVAERLYSEDVLAVEEAGQEQATAPVR
jgi:hypothetical protein